MNCFPLDNTEYEAKDMGAYLGTRTRGVFSAEGNFAVTPAKNGLAVKVSPGLAWLKRDLYWGVAVLLESEITLPLEIADGELERIDVIVCRLDKVANKPEVVVKKGEFSGSPVFAQPQRDDNYDEIYLASVMIQAGATGITKADISSLLLNEDYCGLMRDGVTGIPTKAIQEQATALFNGLYEQLQGRADELEQVIEGIVQGSEVMLRAVYDKDADGVVDEAAAVQAYTPPAQEPEPEPGEETGGEAGMASRAGAGSLKAPRAGGAAAPDEDTEGTQEEAPPEEAVPVGEAFGGPVRLSVDEATGAVKLHAVKQGLDEEGAPVGEESIEEVPVASAQNAAALGGKAEAALSVGNSAKLGGKTLAVSVSGTTGTITFN